MLPKFTTPLATSRVDDDAAFADDVRVVDANVSVVDVVDADVVVNEFVMMRDAATVSNL